MTLWRCTNCGMLDCICPPIELSESEQIALDEYLSELREI